MPKKNGREVYEEIMKMKSDVKCSFTSGYASSVVHKKGVPKGDTICISKPASPPDFSRKVREVLDT
jgi:CheY-like chemotaxis protein